MNDFAAIVTMDAHGNSLHADVEQATGEALEQLQKAMTGAATLKVSFGQVAQLVERSPEKAGVGGSSPSLATTPSIRLARSRSVRPLVSRPLVSESILFPNVRVATPTPNSTRLHRLAP